MSEHQPEHPGEAQEIDPIWTSSRTARQIYALGEVEKVCILASVPYISRNWAHRTYLAYSRWQHRPYLY